MTDVQKVLREIERMEMGCEFIEEQTSGPGVWTSMRLATKMLRHLLAGNLENAGETGTPYAVTADNAIRAAAEEIP